MPTTLILTRYGSTPFGTVGRLVTPSHHTYSTLEPQWKKNQKGISCIPAGSYFLGLRESPIVKRTSRNKFTKGFEVRDVPGRSLIMIHPGNWQENSNGCILVGRDYGAPGGKAGITKSGEAFTELMNMLLKESEPLELLIKWQMPENGKVLPGYLI